MKTLARCVWGILIAMLLVSAGAAAKSGVSCPLKPGGVPTGGDVQWAFTVSGAPKGTRHGVKSSYTHGRGSWTKGNATGKACSSDALTSGPARDLVMSVSGKSKLSPKVHEFGLLGVRIVLPVRVKASDDAACAVGTRGTVTLFASYYAVHRDSMTLHFTGGCANHDLAYRGSKLHVLISRHGAQVNSA